MQEQINTEHCNNNFQFSLKLCAHPAHTQQQDLQTNTQQHTHLGQEFTWVLWFSLSLQRTCRLLPLFLFLLFLLCAVG